jgi:hypothetical protein
MRSSVKFVGRRYLSADVVVIGNEKQFYFLGKSAARAMIYDRSDFHRKNTDRPQHGFLLKFHIER